MSEEKTTITTSTTASTKDEEVPSGPKVRFYLKKIPSKLSVNRRVDRILAATSENGFSFSYSESYYSSCDSSRSSRSSSSRSSRSGSSRSYSSSESSLNRTSIKSSTRSGHSHVEEEGEDLLVLPADSYVEEEGEDLILLPSASEDDILLPVPDDQIFVKLPGMADECAPTESIISGDIPLGGPPDESLAQSFKLKNPIWNRPSLTVSVVVLILGGVAAYLCLRSFGIAPKMGSL